MNIPVEYEEVILIDSSDLEEYIESLYGKKFSFVQYYETGNDSIHDLTVMADDDMDSEWIAFNAKKLERWKNHQQSEYLRNIEDLIDPEVLFHDMCRNGKFPAGKYKVHIWW